MTRYVLPFRELTLDRLAVVGGKNASLGVLLVHLGPAGIRVPDGFALTAAAFRLHLAEAGLAESIYQELDQARPP
jgi:pyruvate,water dikinase